MLLKLVEKTMKYYQRPGQLSLRQTEDCCPGTHATMTSLVHICKSLRRLNVHPAPLTLLETLSQACLTRA